MSKRKKALAEAEPSCEHLEEIGASDFDWELHKLVNWYRRHPTSKKNEKQWAIDYIKHRFGKRKSNEYKGADQHDYAFIACYCRILSNLPKDFEIPIKSVREMLEGELHRIQKKTSLKAPSRKEKAKESPRKIISVQDRITNQIQEYMGEIERQVDILFTTPEMKKVDWFRLDKWATRNNIKGQQANAIVQNIKRLASEIEESCDGECVQLKEGYKFLSKPNRRRILDCLQTWLFHLEKHIESLSKTRTLSKKAISPERRVKKTSYLSEFEDGGLDIVSLHPKKIIYSSVAVVYDTFNRLVSVYVAKPNKQLTIEGTTMKNYRDDESYTKKVRSPVSCVGVCSKCNNKGLVIKHLDELKTKRQPIRKRLNKNTVILKVF
ncbi:TPA: hypothetical protein HA278_02745 [Candidatus Woesearchaeota archaeon]|nr:hypothetical protein [Candidatus Woesearchaeota archaeon]